MDEGRRLWRLFLRAGLDRLDFPPQNRVGDSMVVERRAEIAPLALFVLAHLLFGGLVQLVDAALELRVTRFRVEFLEAPSLFENVDYVAWQLEVVVGVECHLLGDGRRGDGLLDGFSEGAD